MDMTEAIEYWRSWLKQDLSNSREGLTHVEKRLAAPFI